MQKLAFRAAKKMSQILPGIISGIQLEFLADANITNSQFIMLVVLYHFDRIPMNALAKKMDISMPTATGLVDRLQAKGYVRRLADARDRRRVYAGLTPKGQKIILAFKQMVCRRWSAILGWLDKEHLEQFNRVLDILQQHLGKKND